MPVSDQQERDAATGAPEAAPRCPARVALEQLCAALEAAGQADLTTDGRKALQSFCVDEQLTLYVAKQSQNAKDMVDHLRKQARDHDCSATRIHLGEEEWISPKDVPDLARDLRRELRTARDRVGVLEAKLARRGIRARVWAFFHGGDGL